MAERFDINAVVAGATEFYVAAPNTLPPVLGYPITQAQASTLAGKLADATLTRPATGLDRLWKTGDTSTGDIALGASKSLTDLAVDFSGSAPTLTAKITSTVTVAGSSGAYTYTGTDSAFFTGNSIYITHEGRSAEFKFPEATSAVNASSVTTFTWQLGDMLDADRTRAYTLYTIALGDTFTFRVADSDGKDEITGHNSLWRRFGDGLIARNSSSFRFELDYEPLQLEAVGVDVEQYVTNGRGVLNLTTYSASTTFLSELLETNITTYAAPQSGGSDSGPAYQEIDLTVPDTAKKFAICMRVNDAPNENGKMMQAWFPVCSVRSNIGISVGRTPQGNQAEVSTLYSEVADVAARLQVQTNDWEFSS